MYAIVYRTDGFPICRQVPGIEPDPVVTWNTEDAAKAFISSKGGEADFEPVQLTDDAMDKLAAAIGCDGSPSQRSAMRMADARTSREVSASARCTTPGSIASRPSRLTSAIAMSTFHDPEKLVAGSKRFCPSCM